MENRLWNTLWPVPEYKRICEIEGSHSSISDAMPYRLAVTHILYKLFLSPGVECTDPEKGGNKLLRNVGNYLLKSEQSMEISAPLALGNGIPSSRLS